MVAEALALINEEGLEGLSMRALADRLEVKAASLYWHVRDRRELMELLAESILESTSRPRRASEWRAGVLAIGQALRQQVVKHKDAERILLEAPEAIRRSDVFRDLSRLLQEAGLEPIEAGAVAQMVMTSVIAGQVAVDAPAARAGTSASIAIDSGSRGVVLRAGPADMPSLIRVPPDQSTAAPAVMRGETVVVRRLRGTGHGVIELNPRHPWRVQVQAPTWKTVLDLAGLDVREIRVDSGATSVEAFLPVPRGVVPIHISSGVIGVSLHRPREAAALAIVHAGAVKLKLDDYSTKVAVFDLRWQSVGAGSMSDRYELDVSSGVVKFELDMNMPKGQTAVGPSILRPPPRRSGGEGASALEILLDGVEARVKSRPS